MMANVPFLELRNVSKTYAQPRGFLRRTGRLQAVANVSLHVAEHEALGLVGESGSGKSTLGRIAVGLEEPDAGEVRLAGQALRTLPNLGRRARLLSLQMIFQNPVASLNPRQRVRQIIGEPIHVHRHDLDRAAMTDKLADQVGLPVSLLERFPHEMSGGQCQRVGIARALAVDPRLLVCDEPVSALDVSIQAQVLNLFADLKEQLGYAFLFISHDLHVVELLCDRVAIMYLGRIVEIGPKRSIYATPHHPYTRALLDAAPHIGRKRDGLTVLKGEIPSPMDPPRGCPFHPRCQSAMAICREVEPATITVGNDHFAACHLFGSDSAAEAQTSRSTGAQAC